MIICLIIEMHSIHFFVFFTLAYDGKFHHHSAKKMSVHKQNAEIRSELVRGGRKREARDRERMGECRDAEEE